VREVRASHSHPSSDAARRESGHASEQGKEGQAKREEDKGKASAGVMRLQAKLLMPPTPLTTAKHHAVVRILVTLPWSSASNSDDEDLECPSCVISLTSPYLTGHLGYPLVTTPSPFFLSTAFLCFAVRWASSFPLGLWPAPQLAKSDYRR
jgi:hypothetical protein